MPLSQHSFSDLYLHEAGSLSCIKDLKGSAVSPAPIPEDSLADADRLLRDLLALPDHAMEYRHQHDGQWYRVSVIPAVTGRTFVLRRSVEAIPPIKSLGLPWWVEERLMARNLKGLIFITGEFASGKTTTASSIVASRLSAFGGVAVSIEDPVELPLEGRHGPGVCYQIEVQEGGFAEAIRKTARFAPDIIFVGELRDREAAEAALNTAINGKLIIATSHGSSIMDSVERLHSMAGGGAEGSDASSLIAAGASVLMHQTLRRARGVIEGVTLESLIFGGVSEDEVLGMRQQVREKRFRMLNSTISQQRMRFESMRRS